MLPTSYKGDATIDGEPIAAELCLGADDLALTVGEGDEVLRWPLTSLDIELMKEGNYRLQRGEESFLFAPTVDDGLGDEVSLRRRFSGEESSPPEQNHTTIADRVRDAGRGSHRQTRALPSLELPALRAARDLSLGSAVLILGLLALSVLGVALMTGAFAGDPEVVVAGQEATDIAPATVAAQPSVSTPPTVAPTTVPAEPPTTSPPPTVASATVTTAPPTTITTEVVPADLAAFAMTPEQLMERWDALAGPLSSSLLSVDVEAGTEEYRFNVGPFVTVGGAVGTEGLVENLIFTGDPSGTRDDDRDVLSALGLSVAIVEPTLPPEGRRELITALGLDLENPVLADLDGTLDYLGNTYRLRWDPEAELLVFEVAPVDDNDTEESADEGS